LIPEVPTIDEHIYEIAGGSLSGLGVGGMATKIQAAQLATRSGTRTIITNGRTPDVLVRLMAGEKLGTTFIPAMGYVESRKRWLMAERPQGRLVIDQGAVQVLRQQGASLLPVGIRFVQNDFERGAVVLVVDEQGHALAQGLVNYGSFELDRVRGHRSSQIVDVLGYTYGDEAIHRDNLVFM
jgi:glutamate 5-kinase